MRIKTLLAAIMLCGGMAYAQEDPIVMKINGQPISRSEFEYSYNKNNAEGVIDKKSVKEYVDLFVNYKLKVIAAEAAGIDTTQAFLREFAGYRDQQIRPAFISDEDIEAEARKIYDETSSQINSQGGMVKPAHILIQLKQQGDDDEQALAKERIDSIYQVLKDGADFAEIAKRYSDDKVSAENGGELPWVTKGQLVKEFEDVAFAMKPNEMSEPVKSPFGWHIILQKGKQDFFPYDSVRADIHRFIEQRGMRENIINQRLDSIAKAKGEGTTVAEVLEAKRLELEEQDSDLKYLIKEYHDGLLLYEISNKKVWEKAANDESGLKQLFAKNRKKYNWAEPRFKGIAYHVKKKEDVKAVKDCIKNISFNEWPEKLRTTFNNDSVLRIRVERGIFKAGDNSLIDREVFKKKVEVKPTKDFPIDATFGKKLGKKPEELDDVRSWVVADYQDILEKQWVAELREQYPVEIYSDVLDTINKH